MRQIKGVLGTLLVFGFILGACRSTPQNQVTDELYTFLQNNCHSIKQKNIVTYYFDGDCSFCIGQIIELEERYEKKQDTMVICIAKTRNSAYLRFQLKEHNISPCLIIMNDSTRYDSLIQKQFVVNKTYVIGKDHEVVPFSL